MASTPFNLCTGTDTSVSNMQQMFIGYLSISLKWKDTIPPSHTQWIRNNVI